MPFKIQHFFHLLIFRQDLISRCENIISLQFFCDKPFYCVARKTTQTARSEIANTLLRRCCTTQRNAFSANPTLQLLSLESFQILQNNFQLFGCAIYTLNFLYEILVALISVISILLRINGTLCIYTYIGQLKMIYQVSLKLDASQISSI